MLIFDGHLDLALNALQHERDPRLSVARQRRREAAGVPDERGTASVGLPDMRRGNVAACVGTLLARAKPWGKASRPQPRASSDWPTQEMAHAVAQGHLAYYRELERRQAVRILSKRDELDAHWSQWEAHFRTLNPETARREGGAEASPAADPPSGGRRSRGHPSEAPSEAPTEAAGSERRETRERRDAAPPVALILTMEGADPIVEPDQLRQWHDQGLRTLMLAHFGRSCYAHGTPSTAWANAHDVNGPLTAHGRALLDAMGELAMPLDLSHLSDASFQEAVERFDGPIYSSHTACRSLVPENWKVHPMRMHSDRQIRRIVETGAGGVVGLPLFNAFLYRGYDASVGPDAVTLDHLADHIDHICQLAGSAEHVALGSDLDGGFGSEHTPRGIETHADLARLADPLRSRGYDDKSIADIFGGNWLRFWRGALPG